MARECFRRMSSRTADRFNDFGPSTHPLFLTSRVHLKRHRGESVSIAGFHPVTWHSRKLISTRNVDAFKIRDRHLASDYSVAQPTLPARWPRISSVGRAFVRVITGMFGIRRNRGSTARIQESRTTAYFRRHHGDVGGRPKGWVLLNQDRGRHSLREGGGSTGRREGRANYPQG
jgi:hypothetical protein